MIKKERCIVCGKMKIPQYIHHEGPICSGSCFQNHFWMPQVLQADSPNSVRVHGRLYLIAPETIGEIRGFGGREWVVLFDDGRIVRTNNLWDQGDIPREYQGSLRDNAELISAYTYDKKSS